MCIYKVCILNSVYKAFIFQKIVKKGTTLRQAPQITLFLLTLYVYCILHLKYVYKQCVYIKYVYCIVYIK